jgi:hypothetical protein
MIKYIDYADAVTQDGFMMIDDEVDIWHHIRYETPENTWEEYVQTLNENGYNVSIVVRGNSNSENCGPIGNTPQTFQGLLFETGKQKLVFVMKLSI